MIVPVMAISNLVLTRQIYSEETNGAHAHYREPIPLSILHLNNNDTRSRVFVEASISASILFFPHHYLLALAVNKSPVVYILSPAFDGL